MDEGNALISSFLFKTNLTKNNINETKNFTNLLNNFFNEEKCYAKNEDYDTFRFALVVYIGTPIAIFGVISNTLLIVL